MSGFIGNLIGTGIALLPLAVALLLSKHRKHLQRLHAKAGEWSLLAAVVLMLLAGSLFAYIGIGSWVVSALTWIRGEIGPAGPTVFAIIALTLLGTVVVALLGNAGEKALGSAFFAPIVFAMFSVGLFANIDGFLAPLGQQVAAHIGHALGV